MTLLLNIVFLVFSFVCFPRVGYKWNCRWNDKLDIFFFLNIQTDQRNDKISKLNIFRIRKRAFHQINHTTHTTYSEIKKVGNDFRSKKLISFSFIKSTKGSYIKRHNEKNFQVSYITKEKHISSAYSTYVLMELFSNWNFIHDRNERNRLFLLKTSIKRKLSGLSKMPFGM